MHLIHSLFSVHVKVYSTECCLFACVGGLPAEGLSQVTELFPDFFAARHAVRAVPRIDHVAHLGGISPRDWQTKPCESAAKAARDDHLNLACRGLAFLPTDYAAWLLGREADGPVNVFKASAGLFPLLNGREPPFEAALDFLQFAYTADRVGAYVAPASTVLVPSAVPEGDNLFGALLAHLRRRYSEVYGLGDTLARAPERRDSHIRAG